MQRRNACPSACQQQQQLSAKKTKAREPLLNLYAYEKKMATKNRKRQKYTKPVKPRKGTLITRFRRRPQRSIVVDFFLIVAGVALVVFLIYYWLS